MMESLPSHAGLRESAKAYTRSPGASIYLLHACNLTSIPRPINVDSREPGARREVRLQDDWVHRQSSRSTRSLIMPLIRLIMVDSGLENLASKEKAFGRDCE